MSSTPTPTFSGDFAAQYAAFTLGNIARESATTKRVIAAIPAGKGDYKPDAKSRTALEIADHIVQSEIWFLKSIAAGKFEWAEPTPLGDPQQILAFYEREFGPAYAAAGKVAGDSWLAITDFFGMKMPLFVYANFALVHTVHHRGQLSTYLRAMGGKVPDIYGGSADEPWQQG